MDSDEEVVFLDIDSPDGSQIRRHRSRQRWPWLLLAAVLVVALLVQAHRHPATLSSAPRSAAPSGQSPAPSFSRIAPPQIPGTTPVTVTQLGHPLLGETGNWTLFGRGDGALVRIDLAHGEIIRTVVPGLQSSGPVLFTAAAGEVIIRPIDFVLSYVVPDGRPAQPVPAGFGIGGPIFPSPNPEQVWIDTRDDQHPAFALTSLDGDATGTVMRLPVGSGTLDAAADGAGYLTISQLSGVYQLQPGRVRRISTGRLIAAGPTGWLAAECDRQQYCQRVLVDRTTGQRHTLGRDTPNGGSRPPWGAISPDGRTAAVFDVGSDGHNTVELIDLNTGALRPTSLDLGDGVAEGTISWSPDSRWLFAIDALGALTVLEPATGQVRSLPASLPPLTQLAVRVDR